MRALLLLLPLLPLLLAAAAAGADPRARRGAQVRSGGARVSVLTPRLVRFEHRGDGGDADDFDDDATTVVVNRRLPRVDVDVRRDEARGEIVVETSALVVRFAANKSFAPDTLRVERKLAREGDGTDRVWRFGDENRGQLHGTIRSLDLLGPISLACDGPAGSTKVHNESLHCAEGLVSRSGWAVLDDLESPRIDADDGWWTPPRARRPGAHDFYLFAHGLDYAGALRDFVAIAGKPPMVPKPMLGVWWTRWFDYDGHDLQAVVRQFAMLSLPLDVLVLDMNFHTKHAWGGYSWDRSLFPYPAQTFGGIKRAYGLRLMANLHDDDGVPPHEDAYAAFAAYVGAEGHGNATFPFAACTDPKYAFGLEDVVLEALRLDGAGIDAWWTDWQQGGAQGGCTGGRHNPTFWLNRIRSLRASRRGLDARDVTLGRWGGLGSHRYPVGFSGDVDVVDWSRLAYQPYFTVTATNVAYGMWSHDITGPYQDPELFVRWVQWGVNSPVMRFHERGMSAGACMAGSPGSETGNTCTVGYPWDVPARYFAAVRSTLIHRLRLLPLTYTLHREYHETGLSPLRPAYYAHPDLAMAYEACAPDGERTSFMLGSDLLVAPVVHKARRETGFLAKQALWVPPGRWIELGSLRRVEGPALHTVLADLEEVPTFVRAGGVLPTQRVAETGAAVLGSISRQHGRYTALAFTIFLDAAVSHGQTQVYSDDGESLGYLSGRDGVCYRFNYTFRDRSLAVDLEAACGPCSDCLLAARRATCKVPPLESVEVHVPGVYPLSGASGFRASDQASLFQLDDPSVGPVHLFRQNVDLVEAPVKGMLASCRAAKRELDLVRQTPGATSVGPSWLRRCASFADVINAAALETRGRFTGTLQDFLANVYPGAVLESKTGESSSETPEVADRWLFARSVLGRFEASPTGAADTTTWAES